MNILDFISENMVTVLAGILSLICSIITIFLESKSNVGKMNIQFKSPTMKISLKKNNEIKLADLEQESNNRKE